MTGKVYYAVDLKEDFIKKFQGLVLLINYDGCTIEQEELFNKRCAENNIKIIKVYTTGVNTKRKAIIQTGGYMDGNVCRPLPFST